MSSQRKVTFTPYAPAPIGPYSQAVVANSTLYVSGQIGINARTGKMASDTVGPQAEQAFSNLKAVVEASGATLHNVVKVNIFITNMDNFPIVNEVMKQFFDAPFPARSTIGVASLPRGAQVELEAIVQLPSAKL